MTSTTSLAGRIGIMQGRLIPSTNGELQCSPGARWSEEFVIASELGLNHIELYAERSVDVANPMWSVEGRRAIRTVADETGVQIVSMCINETLERPFDDLDFVKDLVERLSVVIRDLRSEVIVLPLFEASELPSLDRVRARSALRLFADQMAAIGARVAVELGVPAADGLRLLDDVNDPNLGICYDTGNAAGLGFDVLAEIETYDERISHVHAKDKNRAGDNVRFGTGDAQFPWPFTQLNSQGYAGLVTMEATRGKDPVVTAARHVNVLLSA